MIYPSLHHFHPDGYRSLRASGWLWWKRGLPIYFYDRPSVFSPCPSIWGKLWQTGIYWLSKPESIFVHQSPTLNYVFVPFHFKGINGYHIIAPLWFLVNIKPIHRWLNQLTPDISLGYPAHIFPQHDMGIGYPSPTHRFPYETGVNFPSVSLSTTPLRPLGMHS